MLRRPFRAELHRLCGALLALVLLLPTAGTAGAATFEALAIRTAKGTVNFKVEVAQTDAERERGLMYRTELSPDSGMLFDFKLPQPVYMWMKNTYIPLDMVFIASDGRIANIAENTTPLSTDVIASEGQVRAVLELAGGTARAKGIAVGDRVRYRLFPAD